MTLNCHIRNPQDTFATNNECYRNKSMKALDYVHNFPTRNFLKGPLSIMTHCGHGIVHNLNYKKFVYTHHKHKHYLGEGKTTFNSHQLVCVLHTINCVPLHLGA